MGKSTPADVPQQGCSMIDTASKQQGGGEIGERVSKKSQAYKNTQKKHKAINLPKNLIESDSEEYEEDGSCEDDNEQFQQNSYYFNGVIQNLSANELSCNFVGLSLNTKESAKIELLNKLTALVKKHAVPEADTKHKDLKARSPYRNRLHEHKQKPFDRKDLTVTTPHGSGGRVFVNTLAPCVLPESVANFPKDNTLLDAIQDKDFIASVIGLSSDEAEEVFLKFIDQDNQTRSTTARSDSFPQTTHIALPQPTVSPLNHYIMSPQTSPCSTYTDLYDSSYETGSPASTVVTSPGSPGHRLSPPRTSVSSESDQELDLNFEGRYSQSASNIIFVSAAPMMGKPEPNVRPLGEVVNYVSTSASQRLYELSKSTSFCVKHFTIQLVRVVMTTKAEIAADRISGFKKSLMSTMKTKIGNKPHEGDIWQLSIYAHIQFLTAPDRVMEYGSALNCQDARGHPLLYVAAVERYEKPLIARYIAESMSQVGYSPLEPLDEEGNTILHVLADLGDSHMNVLCELLMAVGPNNQPLLSVLVTNKAGQCPLHVAAKSAYPHLTTLLILLRMRARPLETDMYQMTALHYHIQHMAKQPRKCEELEIVRKMLQAPVTLTKESLMTLEKLRSDPSVPADVSSVIFEEIKKNSSKDLRPKKADRR